MKITLKIFENGSLLVEKTFDEGVYRAGRSEFADVNLPSDVISRSHFELRVTDSNAYLTNMSSNGRLKVNGKQIETSELRDGDEVAVGPYQILVSLGEGGGIEAPPPLNDEAPPPMEGEANGNELPDSPPPEDANVELPAPEGSQPQLELADSLPPDLPGGDNGGSSPFQRALSKDFEGTAALNRAETVIESKPVVAKLLFTDGPRKGDELFIEAYEITVGRSKKADIFLDDEKLSRIHAKITRVGMGFRLIDQQSRNGTYVNGVRVLEHPLSSFDTIEIGNSKIKFLIHDMAGGDIGRVGRTSLVESTGQKVAPFEQTKSIQMGSGEKDLFLELREPLPPSAPPLGGAIGAETAPKRKINKTYVLAGALLALLAISLMMPSDKPGDAPKSPVAAVPAPDSKTPTSPQVQIPSVMSKEFLELSPELQRAIEGYYNTALRAGDREMYQEALDNLRKIHDIIPYYKESTSLKENFEKRLKEKQAQVASEKAKKDDKQEVAIMLEEGLQYLKDGDFEKAAEAFNYVFQYEPNNEIAKKGIKAADLRIKDINKVPPDRDPIKEREEQVREMFFKATTAYNESRFQEAIQIAEEIRKIELPGRTDYLNEAKQIIDKARVKQKEQFEPFLIDAKGKYAEGDFKASRALCEEMLIKDPSFSEAQECATKAKNQLKKLAKEAYTLGYILESMNRIEEAKQYWNRAKNYVQPGDDYYNKVMKKLEDYQ